jgi:hypothetical protein
VTIKYGKGYEQPWAVFHGAVEQVREDIVSFFGMPAYEAAGLTLSDLVVNATNLAHAVGAIAAGLGGTVISRDPAPSTPRTPANPAQGNAGSDAWEQASATRPPAEPAVNPLLAVIAQVPDVRSLERLWAENQDAFTDPAVTEAWKARGRALTQRA